MPPSIAASSTHYALVIDAGSSGSRLQIYSWRDPDLERAEIVNEVRSVAPTIQASLSLGDTDETHDIPHAESSKSAQGRGRAWWWPPFLRPGKGKGKQREFEVKELERRALRRLVRVSKGVEGDDWVRKVEPGISRQSPSSIPSYLSPLLSHAIQHIPPSQHSHTPIYLYATAGMRLLPQAEQDAILAATCETLRNDYPFRVGHPSDVGPCGENIRVISGEEEGMWGWVAVNYLMDGFGHAPPYDHQAYSGSGKGKGKGKTLADPESSLLPLAPLADAPPDSASDSVTPVDVQHHSPTFGFLDMGGASTQLAFSPTAAEIERSGYPRDDLRHVGLRLLSGEEVEWPVFVASWLGFGTNQARERYVSALLDSWRSSLTGGAAQDRPIPDPCLPVGLSIPSSLDTDTPALVGTGDFGSCLTHLRPLLDHAHPCPTNHCLFGGQPTPHIDFARQDQRGFIGVSEYWYTAHQVLGLGGVWDWGEWEKGMNAFCARDWKGVEKQLEQDAMWEGNHVEMSRLQMQCFKGAWISNILHEGIGIPRLIDSGGHGTLTGEVGGTNAEAERRAREKGLLEDSDSASSSSKKYFQSMDEVDSTAISWTLGKMVIEASKAVPPRSSTAENAWRARLPMFGLGRVNNAMEHVGVDVVYGYAVLGAVVLIVLWNWVRGRRKFPLSSPRGRGRKPSISEGGAAGRRGPRLFFAHSSDEEEEALGGGVSSGAGLSGSNSSSSNRNRATVGRVRLWSLRIANSIRRTLPTPWRNGPHDTLSLSRLGTGTPSHHPYPSHLSAPYGGGGRGRMTRNASLPIPPHGLNFGTSSSYSPSGYGSQPPSPRMGSSQFDFGSRTASIDSNAPGAGGMGLSGYFERDSEFGPGSGSGSGNGTGTLSVPIPRPASTSIETSSILTGSSPPRGSRTSGRGRLRTASSHSNLTASTGVGAGGAGLGGSGGAGGAGSGIGANSTGGWNDPPMSVFAHSNHPGAKSASSQSLAGGGAGASGTASAGVLTPSASGISRQSSRVNLSEMGLKERSGSRMGSNAGMNTL